MERPGQGGKCAALFRNRRDKIANYRRQFGLSDHFRGLADRKPLAIPEIHFRPVGQFFRHSERKNIDVDLANPGRVEEFAVAIATDCRPTDLPPNAALLFRLLGGSIVRLHPLVDISLWNDPSPGAKGRDKQNLNLAARAMPGGAKR